MLLITLAILILCILLKINETGDEDATLVGIVCSAIVLVIMLLCIPLTNNYAEFYHNYTNVSLAAKQTNQITGALKDDVLNVNTQIIANQHNKDNPYEKPYIRN